MTKKKSKEQNLQQGTVSGYTIKYLPLTVRELRGGSLTQDPKITVALEVRLPEVDGEPQRPISVQCPQRERLMKGVDPTPDLFQEINKEVTAAYPINSTCTFSATPKTMRNRADEEFTLTRFKLVE
jgi:hypothetical protein